MITPETDFKEGQLLLMDKGLDWTSFDVVNKVRTQLKYRRNLPKIKVGHAGTLDPLASGLLLICTGKMTKQIEKFQGLSKEYTATLEFGKTTPSFDKETEPDAHFETAHITPEAIEAMIPKFIGESEQMPPHYSAKRVNGQRAYLSARKGKTLPLKPASVCIHSIEILDMDLPFLTLKIHCSKGTYIRALVRDMGQSLNSGAYLTSLRRTRIGNYSVEDAMTVEEFEKLL